MFLDDVTREDVSRLVAGACSGDWASRLRSLEQLDELAPYGRLMRIGLSESECVALVRAAGEAWPKPDGKGPIGLLHDNPVRCLLSCACQSPHPACLPGLFKLYPRLTHDEWAQWQALMLLSCMPQREAAEQWVQWYRELWHAGRGSPPPLGFWPTEGLHADVILPALLEFADTSRMPSPDEWLAERLIGYVVMYVKSSPARASVVDWAISEAGRALGALPAVAARPYSTSRWDEPFPRYKAAQLLTLLGYAGGTGAISRLKAAVEHDDPRVACAAVASLLRLGERVQPGSVERVAADPETRQELHDLLRPLKRARLIPRKWVTQERLAEADMVAWLIADVDAAPDELKLLERIERDHCRHYVFAFRYLPPHPASKDAWMAGISGPWPPSGAGKHEACGGTYSRFEPASAFPPEEHLRRNLHR